MAITEQFTIVIRGSPDTSSAKSLQVELAVVFQINPHRNKKDTRDIPLLKNLEEQEIS
jgi:hypothetical protein